MTPNRVIRLIDLFVYNDLAMLFPRRKVAIIACGVAALFAAAPFAGAQDEERGEYFESRVRPLFAAQCNACHTGAASGGLRLDSREAVLKGGNSGPAVVPGAPEESLLMTIVNYKHERIKMPPVGKMPDEDLAVLKQWIGDGAYWPESTGATSAPVATGYVITPQQKAFWSFQAIADHEPPNVDNGRWSNSPVDRFVYEKLVEKKLKPAEKASKLTLIRRASYDLIGLPPTPQEVDEFLADETPQAFEKVVDRLLASPRYGERWGRHWLDVVRYADTAGDASDYPIPQAYQYRDYVIAAFNNDKPYDEFLQEQLAGDLLPYKDDDERWEHIIATGYLALARRFNVAPLQNMHLTYDDTVDNLGKAVFGLTISCARCHDHKFDPISNHDYFGLYGIFSSTQYPYPGSEKGHRPKDLVARNQAEYDTVLAPFYEELFKITSRLGKVEGQKRAFVEGVSDRSLEEILAEIKELEGQRDPMLANTPKVELAFAVVEGKPENAKVQKGGDPRAEGEEVPRSFLSILDDQKEPHHFVGSGRLELASWVTSQSNPLPPRVMVNRIWQHHFGKGIVATPSDFGRRGTAPTHPELLDYLAQKFVDGGWSIKSMHRMMMLTEAYQLSSEGDLSNADIDGNNDFLWKFNRNRLDAESMRDSMLALSGELDLTPGGEHPFPHMGTWQFMQHGPFTAVYESKKRSVYLMTQRISRHPYLSMFDGADASLSTASRLMTITPIQALFSMNSEFVFEQSDIWAQKLIRELPEEHRRIRHAYRTAYGRPVAEDELELARTYLASTKTRLSSSGTPAGDLDREALASYLRALMASNEFLFVE